MATFAERLKELRNKHQMTQDQLADALGLSRSAIAGYESKGHEPPFEIVAKIADYFGVSVGYLVGATDEPRPLIRLLAHAFKNDSDLSELLTAYADRDELRIAFRKLKDLDPATIKKVLRVIELIEEEEKD